MVVISARPDLPRGPFLVAGLARSGSAVARALAERGEQVIGVDSGHPEHAEGLTGTGVEVVLDVDGVRQLERARCVVKSPGVPQEAPVVVAARDRGVPVLGELEVAWRMVENRTVAVTGTNGKTTVTELIGHVHREAGLPVAVAGNVGTPLASLAGDVDPAATVVCECSSFQLEDTERFDPECAVFLNFAPDHLDRHPSLDDYLEAKLRIFANQTEDDVAVYDADEPALRGRELGGKARRIPYCSQSSDVGCELSVVDGSIVAEGESLVATSELSLLGPHNAANAIAAAAASLAMDVPRDAVAAGLRSFPGVPHRLERIAEIDGVAYVNDSKATNAAAAAAALRSFDGGVRAILGGSSKGETFEGLVEPVTERCVACYLIGDAAEQLERDLAPIRERGVEVSRERDLEAAVRAAAAAARPGEVVLLAPACASFDSYRDFEARGEHFRALVGSLA